jgi:thiamine biosynthesis lipoprotein
MTGMNSSYSLHKIEFSSMGTNVSADVVQNEEHSRKETEKALEGIKEIFENNEKIFSRFREDSELSRLNSSLRKKMNVSEEMWKVLELCIGYNAKTDGYFDPRIIGNLEKIGYDKSFKKNDFSSDVEIDDILEKNDTRLAHDVLLDEFKKTVQFKKRIDVAGVVKGYTVDKAAGYLIRKGFNNFIVEAGGDIFAGGADEKKENWIIDVEGVSKEKIMLKLNNEGIATSGIGRRRWRRGGKKVHHLINPKDPENFPLDLKGVTVISKNTTEADVLAKSLFLMGKESGIKFANGQGIKALFLDYKGNVYLSEAMKEKLIT